MCGIVGYLPLHKVNTHPTEILKKMTDIIDHRGPDGEGFFSNDHIGLGHRRLSIIDLVTGQQPMYSQEKSHVIVFNGEIYNYIELREELKTLGHIFSTESDTEVILKAYEQWDLGLHEKLNGMWAFALWDNKKKRLLLSRDRLGEKPIHYAVEKDTFLFASEIKSLLAYGLPKEPNWAVLEIFLALGYVPAPYSFYKNIYKLKPGCYITVENGRIREQEYWNLPDIDEGNMFSIREKVYDEFAFLLRDSIRIRMRSDVAFGAFLSGGLDSSTIVGLMSGMSNRPVETFTIGFDEKEYDERPLARSVARSFKTNHHEYSVTPGTCEESLMEIINHFDEPFGDSSAIAVGHISQHARERVKMVLTGDGGDEALSGYNSYQSEKFSGYYKKVPAFMRYLPSIVIKLTSMAVPSNKRFLLHRIKNVLDTSDLSFNDRLLTKSVWAHIDLIRELIGPLSSNALRIEELLEDFMRRCNYKDNFYRMMYFNLRFSLPEDMLVKVDRMSMAHSLETRIPFLDHRLIEFMVRVHKNIKMRFFERKSVLRHSVGQMLPSVVLKARKKGFVVPLRVWFRGETLSPYVKRVLVENSIDMNKRVLERLLQDNLAGRKDYGNFLWMLIILDGWLRK